MSDLQKPHPAIKNFTPEQWEEMIDKLMGFTYKYFKMLFKGNIKNSQAPDGSTYEDIAQEIVLKVLEGARRWNPDKDGDLLPYMAGQVKSLVNHRFNSWSARHVVSMSEREDEELYLVIETSQNEFSSAETSQRVPNTFTTNRKLGEIEEQEKIDENEPIYALLNNSPNPELVLISSEHQVERDHLLETVIDAVVQTNDEDLLEIVEAYLDDSGEYKPQDIASRLHITTDEFHNRRKRLVRCVQKFVSEQSSGMGGCDVRGN